MSKKGKRKMKYYMAKSEYADEIYGWQYPAPISEDEVKQLAVEWDDPDLPEKLNLMEKLDEYDGIVVLNACDWTIRWDAAVELMDDEIRETLHQKGYETEQEFFTAYEKAHMEKFGEYWELSKENPYY